MNTLHSKQYLDNINFKIIETNSECESDQETNNYRRMYNQLTVELAKLKEELSKDQIIKKQALESCEHFKKINSNLLNAMTQMTQQKTRSYQSLLEKEIIQETEKYERNICQLKKSYQIRLQSTNNKCSIFQKINQQLKQELQRLKHQNIEMTQQFAVIKKQNDDIKSQLNEKKFMQALKNQYQTLHKQNKYLEAQQELNQCYKTIEQLKIRIEMLQEQFEQTCAKYESDNKKILEMERKVFQSNMQSILFEKKILKKDIDNLKKQQSNLKKEIEEHDLAAARIREEENKKWYQINQKLMQKLNHQQEIINKKDVEIKNAKRQISNVKIVGQKFRNNMIDIQKKNKTLEALLSEAKFHLIQLDLDKQNIEAKLKAQIKNLKQENQKLKHQIKILKQNQQRRSKVLQEFLQNDSKILQMSKNKQKRTSSMYSTLELERSNKHNKINNENDQNVNNVFEFSEQNLNKLTPLIESRADSISQKQNNATVIKMRNKTKKYSPLGKNQTVIINTKKRQNIIHTVR